MQEKFTIQEAMKRVQERFDSVSPSVEELSTEAKKALGKYPVLMQRPKNDIVDQERAERVVQKLSLEK